MWWSTSSRNRTPSRSAIGGGAAGSGSVSSNPSGITCTISNGAAGATGCSSPYSLNQQVTVTATASSGSYLKAWAGGGCDATGTGVGGMSGTCVVVMSQAVSLVVSFDRPANTALVGQWDNSDHFVAGIRRSRSTRTCCPTAKS